MILGFTGTRRGMSSAQIHNVRVYLLQHNNVISKHLNGACHGADRQMAALVTGYTEAAIEFLPGDEEQYEWALSKVSNRVSVQPSQPYMKRNRAIVQGSELVLAVPFSNYEVRRSGSWATVRISRAMGVPVTIMWPNGTVTEGRKWHEMSVSANK